ncbi:MAG: glycosyltransferase family 4 protein [Candidatus Pacebacteria bacterium]|nr:glycosyltransferase family 4 protein [Candidatus Paceibacterota bacterium]
MKNKELIVCFFGRYDPNYSRSRTLVLGLKENGANIIECRTELKGVIKYFDLIKKHWKIRKEYDVLLVAFPGWHAAILSRFLTRKLIIFDALVSIYDSTVFDRKNTKKEGLKAKYFWFTDWLSCKLVDKVILDTDEHINYFVQEFGLKKEKFVKVLLGTDTRFFKPKPIIKNTKFIIQHQGNIVPLQGVIFILEAARLLEDNKDIQFNIVSSRIKRTHEKKGFLNVNFINDVLYEKLPDYISQADLCLGIFGDTNKTQRVIPHKVYEYVSMKKPVITADTPAVRELFNDDDLYLVPAANPQELAKAILKLKADRELREKLAQNSYNKFMQKCTLETLGKELVKIINEIQS